MKQYIPIPRKGIFRKLPHFPLFFYRALRNISQTFLTPPPKKTWPELLHPKGGVVSDNCIQLDQL
jgi:hypothetical protein